MRIRALGPDDRALVVDGFNRLSMSTIQSRYLSYVKPTASLFRWVGELDGRDRIAVGASHAMTGESLGLARCIRYQGDPSRADIAVTVVDGWQRHGVGTALVEELARLASRAGITTFSATCYADNHGARALARKLGTVRFGPTSRGVTSMEIAVPQAPAPPRARRSLLPRKRSSYRRGGRARPLASAPIDSLQSC